MNLPPLTLAESTRRLERLGLDVSVRPVNRDGGGELSYVWETAVKVRWPRALGFTWPEWSAVYGPRVAAVIETGRALVIDATPPDSASSVLLGCVLADSHGRVLCLHVKPDFRGHGLGVRLLSALDLPHPIPVGGTNPSWERWSRGRGLSWYLDAASVEARHD